MLKYSTLFLLIILLHGCRSYEQAASEETFDSMYQDPYRPQVHFSPKENWMNDPNGMVYHEGEYHLFYQYFPDSTVWGPMHWGHAVSNDLVHWEHLPIALYPDSLGYIFSGSVVVDVNNSSSFGTNAKPPLVAIYTYHSPEKERAGRIDYQTQGIAYSLDNGRTWKKYEKNPVLQNPGIKDFRDPKVFWHESSKKWVMILAVLDHVALYNSPDLKTWTKLSEFGKNEGAHGGVWECPDLFQLKIEGEEKQKWVMLVSINPGGPNVGSATQYFIGEFDGKLFTPDSSIVQTRWIDWGQDNYAGVTFSNAPKNREIFMGWMNNWPYAQVVPTEKWRGATTVPRELSLVRINENLFVKSIPVPEFENSAKTSLRLVDLNIKDSIDFTPQIKFPMNASVIHGITELKDFFIALSNSKNQSIKVGYDTQSDRFYVDRSRSGKTDFSEDFHDVIYASRYSNDNKMRFTLVVDVSSIEVFFDGGVTSMTNTFFLDEPFDQLKIHSSDTPLKLELLEIKQLESIWKK